MKPLLNLFILCIISFSVYSQSLSGDSWRQSKNTGSGVLHVVYYDQTGIIHKDQNGKFKGVCVEILNDFVEFLKTKHKTNIEIRYVKQEEDFSKFMKLVKDQANLLGAGNISITEERKKIYKFTPAYMPNIVVMLTHKDAPSLNDLSEVKEKLNGYTAEVIAESVSVRIIERIKKEYVPTLKVNTMPTGDAMLYSISKNPQAFGIADFTEYLNAMQKKLPIKRQLIDMGKSEDLGFIMSRQSDWDAPWNEFLNTDYKKSERYNYIITSNLGSSFLKLTTLQN